MEKEIIRYFIPAIMTYNYTIFISSKDLKNKNYYPAIDGEFEITQDEANMRAVQHNSEIVSLEEFMDVLKEEFSLDEIEEDCVCDDDFKELFNN